MAHFAQVVDGLVTKVYVVANPVITDDDGNEQEGLGQKFLAALYNAPATQFVQCSYNHSFRNVFPAEGDVYDETRDAFLRPQPFPSWTIDDTLKWVPPVPWLSADVVARWDEDAGDWVTADEAV